MTSDELVVQIGARLRAAREARDLTLQHVATVANMSVSYVSMLEKGERSPSVESLLSLSRALEVPVANFFTDDTNLAWMQRVTVTLRPLIVVVERLHLGPAEVLKAARVVWAVFAKKGAGSPV